jgi:predicted ATPase
VLLEPLGPDDSGALLEGLAGGDPLPVPARERITRAAGGNPLFIEELLAALVEEGRLRRQDGAWVVAGDLATTGTPATIQALIAARLDRLDARDRDVLERAAVVGQAFELETVAELSMPQARAEVPDRLPRSAPGCCWPSPRPWPRPSIRGTTRALSSPRTGRVGPRRFRRC